jgi:hypothetical protein
MKTSMIVFCGRLQMNNCNMWPSIVVQCKPSLRFAIFNSLGEVCLVEKSLKKEQASCDDVTLEQTCM